VCEFKPQWSGRWELDPNKNNQERIILEYYVIYDKNDNLLAYCENLDELSKFVNRRKKELKYRFKDKNIFNIQVPVLLKIYKFI